tara:strand:+ start:588 stop:821 length:234 start_codon:yes stop_codon:yes gene_type:complete
MTTCLRVLFDLMEACNLDSANEMDDFLSCEEEDNDLLGLIGLLVLVLVLLRAYPSSGSDAEFVFALAHRPIDILFIG